MYASLESPSPDFPTKISVNSLLLLSNNLKLGFSPIPSSLCFFDLYLQACFFEARLML